MVQFVGWLQISKDCRSPNPREIRSPLGGVRLQWIDHERDCRNSSFMRRLMFNSTSHSQTIALDDLLTPSIAYFCHRHLKVFFLVQPISVRFDRWCASGKYRVSKPLPLSLTSLLTAMAANERDINDSLLSQGRASRRIASELRNASIVPDDYFKQFEKAWKIGDSRG